MFKSKQSNSDAMVSIKLKTGVATIGRCYNAGDVGTFPLADAQRMVDRGYADFVGSPAAQTGKEK